MRIVRGPGSPRVAVRAAALALVVAGTAALLGGCAEAGTPKSAGRAAAVTGPVQLWPERPPAPPPSPDPGVGVDGTPMPLSPLPRVADIRKVSALSVVQAQIEVDHRRGAPAFDQDEENRIRSCAAKPDARSCPVRAPEYHDLTGDGRNELIVGVEGKEHTLAIWVYMLKNGVMYRILNTAGTPQTVEVAGGKLIMREPTTTPGYETRTVYAWDAKSQVMTNESTQYDWHPHTPAAYRDR
ncbi:hypothetical protein ACIGW8_34345 [Streptomyces sioyaensis]|uniref:hypothetical protein n=1 Tax=Streptomyces sioyaensis TaxID=67364 RepID=UPI0037D5A408